MTGDLRPDLTLERIKRAILLPSFRSLPTTMVAASKPTELTAFGHALAGAFGGVFANAYVAFCHFRSGCCVLIEIVFR